MKLNRKTDIENFIHVVDKCERPVWLNNEEKGIHFNLKSALSMYCGIAALIGEDAGDYELFCDSRTDEGRFLEFLHQNPQVVA